MLQEGELGAWVQEATLLLYILCTITSIFVKYLEPPFQSHQILRYYLLFPTGCRSAAQARLELLILLSQSPDLWVVGIHRYTRPKCSYGP